MEASNQLHNHLSLSRYLACWLLVCAVGGSVGCSTTTRRDTAKTGGLNQFSNLLHHKQKAREIIDPEAGLDEYDAAMVKFEKKQYDEAAQDFKAIAKKFYDYPVEEDALFMVAECRFAAKRYAWAQDAYDGLIKKYQSTRYLEKATKRLYAIGAIWLNGEENTDTTELVQVSASDVREPKTVQRKPVPYSTPLVPNMFDKSRPLFDTQGNALKALKSVWLHDPLGPLADDAIMLTAVYHIRKGHLRDADHYLNVLRTEYPKSEFTKTAFVVGSHVKLASYQGPRYDGRELVDADDLIHSTLNLFPDIDEREALKNELLKIREQGAERYWSQAQYYHHRDKPQAEAIYCERVIKEFPDSKFSELARKRLQTLGPKYWTGMLPTYPGERTLDSEKPASSGKSRVDGAPRPKLPAVGPRANQPKSQPPKGKLIPPRRIQGEPEELPNTEPKQMPAEDSDRPYEESSPGRVPVDDPGIADESSDGNVQRASSNSANGRVKL